MATLTAPREHRISIYQESFRTNGTFLRTRATSPHPITVRLVIMMRDINTMATIQICFQIMISAPKRFRPPQQRVRTSSRRLIMRGGSCIQARKLVNKPSYFCVRHRLVNPRSIRPIPSSRNSRPGSISPDRS